MADRRRTEEEEDPAPSRPDDAILSYLRGRGQVAEGAEEEAGAVAVPGAGATRKEVRRHLTSSRGDAGWTKKDVKRALKRLVKWGALVKRKKAYSAVAVNNMFKDGGTEDEIEKGQGQAVPIAQRMKRSRHRSNDDEDPSKEVELKGADLDDEIRRLEAELAADSDGSDNSGDDHDESDEETERKSSISFGANTVHEIEQHNPQDDSGVICLSELAHERIEPLPGSALPQNKRRTLRGVDSGGGDDDRPKKKKKRKRKDSEEEPQHDVGEGLKDAVRDLLANYVRPSDIHRPPLYCRVCQHQSTSQEEFEAHRASDFHLAAVKEEKKRTYCGLCRKQLTSVVQMEEHLKSRPHRERMDYVKGKQRGAIGPGGRGGGRGRGRGGTGRVRGGGRGRSERQWC
ncbi:hypothetical protein ACHAWF_009550 [Thalassiosira exigua]